MKLSYRGISYESEPLVFETIESDIGGKYRGQTWKERYPRHIPQLKPKSIKYRGVAYSTLPLPKTCRIPKFQEEEIVPLSLVDLSKPDKVIAQETARIHLENMRRNLERRLEVAEANEDKNLVNLLERESLQLTLNA